MLILDINQKLKNPHGETLSTILILLTISYLAISEFIFHKRKKNEAKQLAK